MDASENIQIYFGSKEKYTQFIEKIVKNNITKIVFVSKKNEETFYNIIDKKYIEITNEVKQELLKNSVSLSQMKDQPNKLKYVLYRLKVLKLAFSIQNVF